MESNLKTRTAATSRIKTRHAYFYVLPKISKITFPHLRSEESLSRNGTLCGPPAISSMHHNELLFRKGLGGWLRYNMYMYGFVCRTYIFLPFTLTHSLYMVSVFGVWHWVNCRWFCGFCEIGFWSHKPNTTFGWIS